MVNANGRKKRVIEWPMAIEKRNNSKVQRKKEQRKKRKAQRQHLAEDGPFYGFILIWSRVTHYQLRTANTKVKNIGYSFISVYIREFNSYGFLMILRSFQISIVFLRVIGIRIRTFSSSSREN